jgi:VWFA-related protein
MCGIRAVRFVSALGWLALAGACLGQAPQEVKPRVTANLVQVDAVVTGRQGRHATDLKAEDFEIIQDGQPRKVTHCTFIRTGPAVRRTVAVIVDDLGLSFESVARVRRALNRFIDEQVQPWDMVAIIRTSGDVGALQQFTPDKRQLHAAAEGLRWYGRSRAGICSFQSKRPCHLLSVFGVEPEAGRLSALETLERIISVVKGLAQLPGRKSILLFSEYIALPSDAEVSESATAVERAHERLLDAATRASAAIYSIDPRGLPILGYQSPASNKPVTVVFRGSQAGMGRLAEATGGEFLRDIDDLSIPIRVAMNDQQGYYLLEYEPDSSTFDDGTGQPKFHKIAVRVNRRGLKVRSHTGFEGIEDKRTTPAPGPWVR